MGKTWKEMRDELNKAEKGNGRNPKLSAIGDYKLLVTRSQLIKDEDSKEEKDPDKVKYIGVGVSFKVLEATGSSAHPVGLVVDKPFWTESMESWQRKRNWKTLREFVERLTGEDVDEQGPDLFDELPGFVIYCQVSAGNHPEYPKLTWAHIPQTAEDVLANRQELEDA